MNLSSFSQAPVPDFDTSVPIKSPTISYFPYLYSASVSNVPTYNYEAYPLGIPKWHQLIGCFTTFCKMIYTYVVSEAYVIFCGLKQLDTIPVYTLERVQYHQRICFLLRCCNVKAIIKSSRFGGTWAIGLRCVVALPLIAHYFQSSLRVWLYN
jgi:hypothetical protein